MWAAVLAVALAFVALIVIGGTGVLADRARPVTDWPVAGALSLLFVALRMNAPALMPIQAQVRSHTSGATALAPPSCPLCGSPMRMRTARKDSTNTFWGCPRYPECAGVVNVGRRQQPGRPLSGRRRG